MNSARQLQLMQFGERLDTYASHRLGPSVLAATAAWRRSLGRGRHVVAITGTYGKTTTARTVKLALGLPDPPWTSESRNAYTMVALQWLRQRGQDTAVIEVGIGGPGQMERYARALCPDVVVVTSIGTEHLTAFDSAEHLRQEKAVLVRGCRPSGVAVLNRDDAAVMRMAQETSARTVTYGFDEGADVRILSAEPCDRGGVRVRLAVEGQTHTLDTRLLGRAMAYTLAAAVATAWAIGRDPGEAVAALQDIAPTQGRLELVDLPAGGQLLYDDFKSSVETIHAALDAMADLPAQRRLVVLGDINSPPNANACYREVGHHLGQVAQHAVLLGLTSSRWRKVRRGWRDAGADDAGLAQADGVLEAAALIGAQLRPGDLVLIKGRARQKMRRVGMVLAGETVRCALKDCPLPRTMCDRCRLVGAPLRD